MAEEFHSAMLQQRLRLAQEGNVEAWGWLYALAAHFIARGDPLPAALAEVVAPRLQAVSRTFTSPRVKDRRAPLYDDLAPAPAIRRYGPREKPGMLTEVATDVLRRLGPEASALERKSAIEDARRVLPRKPGTDEPLYTASSIEKRMRELKAGPG